MLLRAAPIRWLPSVQIHCSYQSPKDAVPIGAKAIELLNLHVLRSCGLVCHRRRGVDQLLSWLRRPTTRLLTCWVGALLRCKCLSIDVVLLFSYDVDLILLRSWKDVINFPLYFTGETLYCASPLIACCCLGVVTVMTLTRLRKQELFPRGGSELCVVGGKRSGRLTLAPMPPSR
jgi:hypothetical protein